MPLLPLRRRLLQVCWRHMGCVQARPPASKVQVIAAVALPKARYAISSTQCDESSFEEPPGAGKPWGEPIEATGATIVQAAPVVHKDAYMQTELCRVWTDTSQLQATLDAERQRADILQNKLEATLKEAASVAAKRPISAPVSRPHSPQAAGPAPAHVPMKLQLKDCLDAAAAAAAAAQKKQAPDWLEGLTSRISEIESSFLLMDLHNKLSKLDSEG